MLHTHPLQAGTARHAAAHFMQLAGLDSGRPSPSAGADGSIAPSGTDAALGATLVQVLDLLDYGLVLLDAEGRITHSNRSAQREFDAGHPLQRLASGHWHLASSSDATALREAIHQAAHRGLRRLLSLRHGDGQVSLAVLPLPAQAGARNQGVALLLSRRAVCEPLTVEWFARSHGLTLAETVVVKGLCADLTPQEIARQQGVGLATVRTQIGAVRQKTGACSIRALLRQVSLLPPLASVLQAPRALHA